MRAALNCPSGAIQVTRHDGGARRGQPQGQHHRAFARTARWPSTPRSSSAARPIGTRATLCRCGASNNKPYCDGSHVAAAFVATGEPADEPSAAARPRDGALKITPYPNGPLGIAGASKSSPAPAARSTVSRATALCRCGVPGNKPYCDGTHKASVSSRRDGDVTDNGEEPSMLSEMKTLSPPREDWRGSRAWGRDCDGGRNLGFGAAAGRVAIW